MDARRPLSDALLAGLAELLAQRIGLHFRPERRRDIERGIVAAARELGFPDAESCARALLGSPPTHAELEILASHFTVGETYFFRDRSMFAVLEQHILPELLRTRRETGRRLRIWCAGCCTGEEPYSVAMLLDRLLPDAEAWNVTILGTDINPRFLRQAAQAVYGEWSFRETPAWVRERHFTRRRNGRYQLQARIRGRVTFSHLNLADDAYPSLASNTNAMDIILCRNVLMYFTAERARRAAVNFRRALVGGGWLIVSPTEASNELFAPLVPVQLPEVLVYRNAEEAPSHRNAEEAPPRAPAIELAQPEPQVSLPPEPVAAPEEPGEHIRAARRCAGEGRLDEAAAWCAKAIEADRLNPAHYYLLAVVRQEQGQADAAAQSLIRALYLDPDFALAHYALGNLRLAQGRRAEADRHLANALALLGSRAQDELLPEAEGLTAGRLAEIIASARAGRPRVVRTGAR